MNGAFSKISVALALTAALATFAEAGADQCKPIGWATRSGRTSTAFEVTGGGNATPITVTTFADLQKYAKDSSPRVIYIDGTLGSGWNGREGDRLNITGSNKTIIGLKPGTVLKAPIHITKASNIILRNIVINGPGSNADQAWDNLTIETDGTKNIWIDHCEFWDGQDGNADVVKGADNVTFTWCIFGYKKNSTHNLSNLIGSSDDEPVSEGKLNVTYMFNWWQAAAQRKPRCRYGNVHVVNNLITGNSAITAGTDVLGVAPGYQCTIRAERNHFINENNPFYLGLDKKGVVEAIDNKFTNCSGNTNGNGKSFTPPYDYTDFMLKVDDVEAAIKANAGATLANPTVCDVNYKEPDPPTPDKMYQADKGAATNSFIETTNEGYHGDAYVNFDKGGSVVVPVTVDVAGEYKFEVNFANGSGETRSLVVSAGESSVTKEFKATSAWGVWETETFSLDLAAGKNDVKFATLEGKDGPNLDQFDLILVKATEPETSSSSGTAPESSNSSDVHPESSTTALPWNMAQAQVREANGILHFVGFDRAANVKTQVFSLYGRCVKTSFGVGEVSLRDLPAGAYLVAVSAPGLNHQFIVQNH
ncbi:CBM35 domain-containing protein [Fibrobacter sp.]|uniref:pectate lyase family protein n=1 Tax=Fibrobacter sp. TaxID=35828 RepID=UPI00388E56E5